MSNNKYPALFVTSVVIKIIGWIDLLASIACLVYAAIKWNPTFALWGIGSLLAGLFSLAIAEVIIVLVDIEYNTRSRARSNLKDESFHTNVGETRSTDNETSNFKEDYFARRKNSIASNLKD